MPETAEPERPSTARRAWIIALGALGGAGILAVAGVLVVSRLGGSGVATGGVAPSPSSSPTVSETASASPQTLTRLKGRVLFGVQSNGADISAGVRTAFSRANLSEPKVMSWKKALTTKGPLVATATIGRNGNPSTKLRAFAGLVNDAPRGSVNVALMAFNYQDVSANTDIDSVLQSYQETMESVEAANPDITFLYTTVPVTTSNSWREVNQSEVTGLSNVDQPAWQDNIARERLNWNLRERYASTGRLFDIAALQARIGGGKVAAKLHEQPWYYVMNPGLSTDGKRLNEAGSVRLARELMQLVGAVTKS